MVCYGHLATVEIKLIELDLCLVQGKYMLRGTTVHVFVFPFVGYMLLVILFSSDFIAPKTSATIKKSQATTATPTSVGTTTDPTIQALEKEKLQHEVEQLQKINNPSFWDWISKLGPVGGAGIIAVFGVYQYFANRREERIRRAEERFQKVVEGLGSQSEAIKTGSAVTLRTFLRPGYEEFFAQVFNLAVGGLRYEVTSAGTAPGLPPSPLKQMLVAVLKEAFPLAREQRRRGKPDLLDATGICLFDTYLAEIDLNKVWMPDSDLQHAVLRDAQLMEARFVRACFQHASLDRAKMLRSDMRTANFDDIHAHYTNFSKCKLELATFIKALLSNAIFIEAHLDEANFTDAVVIDADFTNADLFKTILHNAEMKGANPERALRLDGAKMKGVTGLSEEQVAACIAKGASFDN